MEISQLVNPFFLNSLKFRFWKKTRVKSTIDIESGGYLIHWQTNQRPLPKTLDFKSTHRIPSL